MPELVLRKELENLKQFNKDLKWFQDNYDILKPRYKGKYVAIRNGIVIDNDQNAHILLTRLKRDFGDVTSLVVEYINEQETAYIL